MMKEWFPRQQWPINWMCPPQFGWWTLCGDRGKGWSLLLLASEEAKRENIFYNVGCLVLLLACEEAKRENVLCHVEWLVLLLATEEAKRECALSRWLVGPAARRRREEYVLCNVAWLVLLLASGEARREPVLCNVGWLVPLLASREARRGREMVSAVFYVAPGRWPGQNGISHSHLARYINSNSNGQSNARTK